MNNIENIIEYLRGESDYELFSQASLIKSQNIGDKVHLRGLIEVSNRCRKNCLYCGIRATNCNIERYELSQEQIITCAQFAYENGYGSIALQAGEQISEKYIGFIENIIRKIKDLTQGKLGITLSLGEQTTKTYKRWYEAGAHRYLLRIESSNPEIYAKIHPYDHKWSDRLECINSLHEIGYQIGTGVMIGLPGQQLQDLAADLLFFRKLDIDMCGMGPYIEHPDAELGSSEFTLNQRFELSLRMIALLRIMMPNINIAATTALHALREDGRQRGIAVGANIIMPNITPSNVRENYKLYNNKPTSDIDLSDFCVSWNEWGDSQHYKLRSKE